MNFLKKIPLTLVLIGIFGSSTTQVLNACQLPECIRKIIPSWCSRPAGPKREELPQDSNHVKKLEQHLKTINDRDAHAGAIVALSCLLTAGLNEYWSPDAFFACLAGLSGSMLSTWLFNIPKPITAIATSAAAIPCNILIPYLYWYIFESSIIDFTFLAPCTQKDYGIIAAMSGISAGAAEYLVRGIKRCFYACRRRCRKKHD